jgi:hypothetical protein
MRETSVAAGRCDNVNLGPTSYSGYTCSLCGAWLTETVHFCRAVAASPQLSQQWSVDQNPLILSELQAIRLLLEKMVGQNK